MRRRLSHLLARRNIAPSIKNLWGTLDFTGEPIASRWVPDTLTFFYIVVEELNATQRALDSSGMPDFGGIRTRFGVPDDDIGYGSYHRAPKTPELIIEEDEESDPEYEQHTLTRKMTREQSIKAGFMFIFS